MNFLSKFKIVQLFCYFILFFPNNISADNVINILLNTPDFDKTNYLENYNEVINQYFQSKNVDFSIKFSYCVLNEEDGNEISKEYENAESEILVDVEYAKYFNCILRELKNSNYDMMILDERFLFSDQAYIINTLLQSIFHFTKLEDYYVNYNNYNIIKETDLSHHQKDRIENGKLEDDNEEFYGLPYEIDFDVVYYHEDDALLKDTLSTKAKELSQSNSLDQQDVLSVGLGNNDELLNMFSEFIRYQYDIPKENDSSSFKKLYDGSTHEVFSEFRDYITKFSGEKIEETLSTSIEEAYHAFIGKEKKLFRGKASQYKMINSSSNSDSVKINSLPDNKSVINEKYVVINKNSKKSVEELIQVALQLTSSEIQIYRASHLGAIPTFNMTNSADQSVNSYCKENSDLCSMIKTMNPIYIDKIFRMSRNSAAFMETRLVLPMGLKKSLNESNYDLVETTFSNILDLNIGDVMAMKVGFNMVMFMVLLIVTNIVAIYLIIVIIRVHKNRKHPYIKAMSPHLSNLTIFGILLRTIGPYYLAIVTTRFQCRMNSVVNFFSSDMIYLPLFAIVYRIYYIYTNISSVSYGKKLSDTRLLIYILIAIFVTVNVFFGITFFDNNFNITTYGSFYTIRTITCTYNFNLYAIYGTVYSFILFIFMMNMTLKIHKLSRKYGDTRFIFFILALFFSSIFFEMAFASFLNVSNTFSVSVFSIFLHFIEMTISILTVYLLIGNRLKYIKKHHIAKSKMDSSYVNNFDKIAKFIPMKFNSESFSNTRNTNSSSKYFDTSVNERTSESLTIITSTSYKGTENSNYRSFSNALQYFNDTNYNTLIKNTFPNDNDNNSINNNNNNN
eukprot:jgi/Orpsp1_1/1189964/evm.model.d7180000075806.1